MRALAASAPPTSLVWWTSRPPTSATRRIRDRARRTISGAFSRTRCSVLTYGRTPPHRRFRANPSSDRSSGQPRWRVHEDAALSRAIGRALGDVEERARDDDPVDRKRRDDPAQRHAALSLRRG